MSAEIVNADPGKVIRSIVVNAPADELFAMLADPRRHGELDGSGTVLDTVDGPDRLSDGATFSVNMKQYGVPYRIKSRVTAFEEGRLIEWRHPLGHRWRWQFEPLSDRSTRVTETYDYGIAGGTLKAKSYQVFGLPKKNAIGMQATLEKLRARYPASAADQGL